MHRLYVEHKLYISLSHTLVVFILFNIRKLTSVIPLILYVISCY